MSQDKRQEESAGDEQRLVRLAQSGDSQAFGRLYQRYIDRVYSFVLFRVRDPQLAEDLTQEVFIQTLRGLESFDWRGSMAPWILRIARNTVVDHWRRSARRAEQPWSAVEPGDTDDESSRIESVAEEMERSEMARAEMALDRERVSLAAEQLTELQQQVLALRFAAGLSIRETAEVMSRSEGAIKNLQHHALRGLRRALLQSGEAE
ncbi:MAG: RNA polymerase sigma factor [Anaerolineae bacterium]|jgi:RNA polymerase sigma-70 factor (ECF subfamily)